MDVCPLLGRTTRSVNQKDDDAVHHRIRAEFGEMPGLKLTLSQAARLFDLERGRCERVLGTLVDAGELWNDGQSFARVGEGRRWA
jgi:hypothetical protein